MAGFVANKVKKVVKKELAKTVSTSGATDDLIYGKDKTSRIISIENKGGNLHIFRQLENGSIEETTRPSKFWVLSDEHVSSSQTLLDGNQPYKFLATFPTQKERDAVVNICKKNDVDFYRIYNQKEQTLVFEGMTYYKGMKPKEVSVLSWDMETSTMRHQTESQILMISGTFRDHTGKITRKLFSIDDYDHDEAKMIRAFIKWVCLMNPSIMLGHNIYGFDFEYLRFRCQVLGIKISLGRDGSSLQFAHYTSEFRKDGSQSIEYNNCTIFGREIVDTMFLAYQYDFARAFYSYGLKPIINQLGLEKKDRTFVDASKIGRYYKELLETGKSENWELAKKYAEEDSDDALTLFDIFVPAKFYFTQNVSKSFQAMVNSATGSQLNNIMVRSYLQIGHSIAKAFETVDYEGAISFGIPGIYKNGLKCDVSSLYPSIMRQWQVFCATKDPLKHFIQITEYFAVERLRNKKLSKETGDQYYEDLQQSQKIAANSLYGFLGAAGLNYNYPEGAAFITKMGREVLEKATMFATGKSLNYWKNLSGNTELGAED
jgi:DNA polymerase elongation subunit (family B)